MSMVYHDKKICLYGMGVYGIRMYYYLKRKNVEILCFGDKYHGQKTGIEGHRCLSYGEVIKLSKRDTLLIICIKDGEDICREFMDAGFENVYSSTEAERLFANIDDVNDYICDEKRVKYIMEIIARAYIKGTYCIGSHPDEIFLHDVCHVYCDLRDVNNRN